MTCTAFSRILRIADRLNAVVFIMVIVVIFYFMLFMVSALFMLVFMIIREDKRA